MIRVGIVGFGKIARDQHAPAIVADPRFELVATARGEAAGVPQFADLGAMLAAMSGGIDAVAVCTPPLVRPDVAVQALEASCHVLLEKPPAATLGGLARIAAAAGGRTVYTGWHSQHAPAAAAAAVWLAGARLERLTIEWYEDVRKWHPGQDWVWTAGGFGVFDPGINALSIATRLFPAEPFEVASATLETPEGRQAPIAAELAFAGGHSARFDWRARAGEHWIIRAETDRGLLELLDGGARWRVDGAIQAADGAGEYPSIYARFAELIESGASEIDAAPLRIAADAFLVGSRVTTAPFAWA